MECFPFLQIRGRLNCSYKGQLPPSLNFLDECQSVLFNFRKNSLTPLTSRPFCFVLVFFPKCLTKRTVKEPNKKGERFSINVNLNVTCQSAFVLWVQLRLLRWNKWLVGGCVFVCVHTSFLNKWWLGVNRSLISLLTGIKRVGFILNRADAAMHSPRLLKSLRVEDYCLLHHFLCCCVNK